MPNPTRAPRTISRAAGAELSHQLQITYDRPIVETSVEVGEQGDIAPDVRRVTIQARDRRGKEWVERVVMLVVVTDDPGGAPAGTQALTVVSGTLLATFIADQVLLVESNEDGQVVLDIEEGSAATLYVRSAVWCLPYESEAIDFDATVVTNGTPIGLLLALTRV